MIHPLHDPDERVLVAELGNGWEMRQFAEHDRRLAYFADKGFAHVQLWNAAATVSVVTPSRLTGGSFEAWIADAEPGTFCRAARSWSAIEIELAMRRISPPNRHMVRAIEKWFVLPVETRAGRLLRSWWAGAEESAR